MLEHLPRPVGRALRGVRAGFEKVAGEDRAFAQTPDSIALTSPAFEDGGSIPAQYTADGAKISPPLAWNDLPPGTRAVALLVEDPDGRLISFPSTSPENTFRDVEGRRQCLDASPTMDRWIMLELFGSVLDVAQRTGLGDETFLTEVRSALKQIPVPQVGRDGRLLEWSEPFDEFEPGHRHLSHLYGLYPGDEIDVVMTPDLALAARRSLEFRLAHGSGQSGWSCA